MITLELTPEEVAALNQILDAVLKASGMSALAVVTHFNNKLALAQTPQPEPESTPIPLKRV